MAMSNVSRFAIHNDLSEPAVLNIEPECVFLPLGVGDEVTVVDHYTAHPVTIKLSKSDENGLVVSIWPGDGEVRVERGGVDVFEDRVSDEISTSAPRQVSRVAKPPASS